MTNFLAWWRRGTPFVWLTGGTVTLSLLMIGSLVGYIAVKGLGFFWPAPLVLAQTSEGPVLGMINAHEAAQGDNTAKIQFKVGNRDLYGQDFRWIETSAITSMTHPTDVVLVERLEYGVFAGKLRSIQENGQVLAEGDAVFQACESRISEARKIQHSLKRLEKKAVGELNVQIEELRLERIGLETQGKLSPDRVAILDQKNAAFQKRYEAVQRDMDAMKAKAQTLTVTLESVDGQTKEIPLASAVRILPVNRMGFFAKAGTYISRLWEYLADDPRESNTEGGVFPAIFGTVMMVMIMSMMVVPLGVLAALYLREYAKQGWMIRAVRIAVNNLAGVPSIVFGIFGLGFFVYTLGGSIDQILFSEKLPAPTFGTGGILWASLTLALLTVPVVIVSTEEALAAVPRSQREASLALGATKWQTLWSVVLPGATPGILTGLILAMGRGAGEVAPLMLTGVVKLAPSMPMDSIAPFLHLDRKFMHLGFHIYDVGFQSPNSEAAKPMVFMTALLLLMVVVVLNLLAIRMRNRLRARIGGSAF